MNLANLAGDVLVVLPEYLRIAALLAVPVGAAVGAFAVCKWLNGKIDAWVAARYERRIERVEQRMIALNHRDVAERSRGRDFAAWNADADLATVLPFERKTSAEVIPLATRVMDSDGIGGAA